jgi:hypothetical protein
MNADDLFEQLEPPPGGAARFALRLDEAAASAVAPKWRPIALAGAVGAVIVAGALTVVLLRAPSEAVAPVATSQPTPEIYNAPVFDRLLGRPLQAEELTAVVDQQATSVSELESHNDKVRIYQLN